MGWQIDYYTCPNCGRVTNRDVCLCGKNRFKRGTGSIVAEKANQAEEAKRLLIRDIEAPTISQQYC